MATAPSKEFKEARDGVQVGRGGRFERRDGCGVDAGERVIRHRGDYKFSRTNKKRQQAGTFAYCPINY